MGKLLSCLFCALTLNLVSTHSWSASKQVVYFNQIFGHIHQGKGTHTESLTTISCGSPLRLVEASEADFSKVKLGDYEGYIQTDYLVTKKPQCFQGKHSRFFNWLELDIADLYYWGKLYDNYVSAEVKAP